MSEPNNIPTTLVGALILAVTALAGVVVYLFKLYVGRNTTAEANAAKKDEDVARMRAAWDVERESWEAERMRLLMEYERKRADLAEGYAMETGEIRDGALVREDALRKDFGDRLERISAEAAKAAHAQVEVLTKLKERFIGPRRGRTGG